MKTIEDIENNYLTLVKRFIPSRVSQANEIGYQIELFLAENDYVGVRNLRLKEEDDTVSETLYDLVKFEGNSKFSEEDLYLPVDGDKAVFLGFDYEKGV